MLRCSHLYGNVHIIYRTSIQIANEFMERLSDLLLYVYQRCDFVILCGDLNINWQDKCSCTNRLRDLFEAYGMINKNQRPTRLHVNRDGVVTGSEIDYIVCNLPERTFHIDILDPGLSDHSAQLLTLEIPECLVQRHDEPTIYYRRDLCDANIRNLKIALSQDRWNPDDTGDVDSAFDDFLEHFMY